MATLFTDRKEGEEGGSLQMVMYQEKYKPLATIATRLTVILFSYSHSLFSFVSERIMQQLAYHYAAAKSKTVEVLLWKGVPGKSAVYKFQPCKLKFVKISDNRSAAMPSNGGE
jgi:hypothetical protein